MHPRGGEERGQRAHLPGEVGGHDREPRAQAGEPRDLVVVLRLRVRVGLVEQLLGRLLGVGLGLGTGLGLGLGIGLGIGLANPNPNQLLGRLRAPHRRERA